MKRYQYFTQSLVELYLNKNEAALMTLAPLEPYFIACERVIDRIHFKTISSIAKYRLKDASWKEDFGAALDFANEYGFIRTISEYAGEVLPACQKH